MQSRHGRLKKGDIMANKERYDTLKHLKRCVDCGKTDAFTLSGRAYCAECCEKQRKSKQKYSKRNKEKKRKSAKKLYEERKSNHLCVKCGKTLPDNYRYTNCEKCRVKLRQACERYHRKNGIFPRDTSLCYRCQKNTPLKDKKVCAECYKNLCKNIEHASKFIDYDKVKKLSW